MEGSVRIISALGLNFLALVCFVTGFLTCLERQGLAFDPQLLKWMMNAGMEEQKWSYEPCAVSVSISGDAQVAGN